MEGHTGGISREMGSPGLRLPSQPRSRSSGCCLERLRNSCLEVPSPHPAKRRKFLPGRSESRARKGRCFWGPRGGGGGGPEAPSEQPRIAATATQPPAPPRPAPLTLAAAHRAGLRVPRRKAGGRAGGEGWAGPPWPEEGREERRRRGRLQLSERADWPLADREAAAGSGIQALGNRSPSRA